MPEVAIICDEGDVVIDAGLGDEDVGEAGLEALSLKRQAQIPRALPVTGGNRKERQAQHHLAVIAIERAAQYLRDDNRRKDRGAITKRKSDRGRILSRQTIEKSRE